MPGTKVETLNEALKIAAMDIAAAGVSPGVGAGDEDTRSKRSADSDTGSSTGSSESGARQGSVDGAGKDMAQAQQQQQPSSSGGNASRIFVFQDGTFQPR